MTTTSIQQLLAKSSIHSHLYPSLSSDSTTNYQSNDGNILTSTTSLPTTNASSLTSIISPFELEQIPHESEFIMLNTTKFNISVKLLDKILYLRNDNSKFTPLRGYLCINVKKPVRISTIKLEFKGLLNIKLFPNTASPSPTSNLTKSKDINIFQQSRSWQYKPNDKVLDHDYFAKGLFTYPFQFLIPNDIPESMNNIFGSTSYSFNVTVHQTAKGLSANMLFQNNFFQTLPIQVVQCNPETIHSFTSTDALALGNWRNLVYYKISVSNRQISVGDKIKTYIKLLPIKMFNYKLKSIKVILDQITNYNNNDYINDTEKKTYHSFLSYTDSILLDEINCETLDNETDIQSWEIDSKVNKNHLKYDPKNRNLKREVKIVPTTNLIENKICHFHVTHKIKVILDVEEVQYNDDVFEDSDLVSSLTMEKTRSKSRAYSSYAMDKSLLNTRAEKADNEMIKKMAKLVKEKNSERPNVELMLESDIEILKGESVDGNKPPPTYVDVQLEKEILNNQLLNNTKNPVKQSNNLLFESKRHKPKLNFIVPPAYEEIEELFQPPLYIKNL